MSPRSDPIDKARRIRAPEKLTACIWYDRMFAEERLKTADGRPIRVDFPGEWNFGPGPDFRNARLTIGGEAKTGDVEIHNDSADWRRHGHHLNPDYNRVALHVTLWPEMEGPAVPLFNGNEAPQAALLRALSDDLETLFSEIDLSLYPEISLSGAGRCRFELQNHSPDKLTELLDAAGTDRLLRKAERFAREVEKFGFEEAFIKGYVASMGGGFNQGPLRKISERINGKILLRVLELDGPRRRGEGVSSLLFGLAGWLERPEDTRDAPGGEALAELWRNLKTSEGLEPVVRREEWKTTGIRPAARPQRKLEGAAVWLDRQFRRGIPELLFAMVSEIKRAPESEAGSRATLNSLKKRLIVQGVPRGEAPPLPTAGSPPKKSALIGESHAGTLLIDFVLPFLSAWSERDEDPFLMKRILRLHRDAPPAARDRKEKRMAMRMAGPEFRLKTERRRQGLLAIHKDFCGEDVRDCARCALPAALRTVFYGRLKTPGV